MNAPRRRRLAELRWPLLIVAMLSGNVAICAVTIVAATRNPAAVEPDYYDRSLRWDQSRAETAEAADEDAP